MEQYRPLSVLPSVATKQDPEKYLLDTSLNILIKAVYKKVKAYSHDMYQWSPDFKEQQSYKVVGVMSQEALFGHVASEQAADLDIANENFNSQVTFQQTASSSSSILPDAIGVDQTGESTIRQSKPISTSSRPRRHAPRAWPNSVDDEYDDEATFMRPNRGTQQLNRRSSNRSQFRTTFVDPGSAVLDGNASHSSFPSLPK